MLKGLGAAGVAGFAGCLGDDGDDELYELDFVYVEDSIDIPIYLAGQEENIWENHGIDLNVVIAGFSRYVATLPTEETQLGAPPIFEIAESYSEGHEIVSFGPDLVTTNRVFSMADSDISSIEDLAEQGGTLGVPFWGSAATNITRTVIMEETGIDIREDIESDAAEPAVLLNLLEDGEFDAVLLFTGSTISALAQPDTYQPIYNPAGSWEEIAGFPPFLSHISANRVWLEDNYDVAWNFLQGWDDAVEHVENNLDDVMDSYGLLAGVDGADEVERAKELYEAGEITAPSDSWDQDMIDSQWELFESMEDLELISDVPPKDELTLTNAELDDLAN